MKLGKGLFQNSRAKRFITTGNLTKYFGEKHTMPEIT